MCFFAGVVAVLSIRDMMFKTAINVTMIIIINKLKIHSKRFVKNFDGIKFGGSVQAVKVRGQYKTQAG
ncbi:hypothetical protein [Pseudenterobacter timonensis]|uniref:hypothetical protein n=1 Tax=Pseudenterobacter timonensis TaxID=1755099 RepID=UPI00138EF484|nr:hypothetical protein [Pseudenterobacter timonensis]